MYEIISAVLPDDVNVIIFRLDSIALHVIPNPLWVIIKCILFFFASDSRQKIIYPMLEYDAVAG